MDIEAKIVRVERGEDGTFGVLLLNGKAFCVTLELLYRDNVPNISSIPTARYVCKRTKSPLVEEITKGVWEETFEITGVKNRSRVLFHGGNTIKDTEGCVLLGQYFGKLIGDRAVLNSGATFDGFMTVTRTVDQFPLTIFDAIPLW